MYNASTLKAARTLVLAGSLAAGAFACGASQPEIESFSRGNPACAPAHAEKDQAFSVAQAQRALIDAEETASACSRAAKKTSGRVLMTWGTGGCIVNARFHLEAPGLTAQDLDCIADAFFAARIDPFYGELVTVAKAMLPE
jgi:hypothetical protein